MQEYYTLEMENTTQKPNFCCNCKSPVSMWSFPFPVCGIPAYLLQFLPSVFIKKQTLDTDSEHKTQKRGGKNKKTKHNTENHDEQHI